MLFGVSYELAMKTRRLLNAILRLLRVLSVVDFKPIKKLGASDFCTWRRASLMDLYQCPLRTTDSHRSSAITPFFLSNQLTVAAKLWTAF